MKTASDLQQVVNRAAQELLGYEQLRPGQEEAITAVLHGPDTLAVMPTGSGKSAIYQIAPKHPRKSTAVHFPRRSVILRDDLSQAVQSRLPVLLSLCCQQRHPRDS